MILKDPNVIAVLVLAEPNSIERWVRILFATSLQLVSFSFWPSHSDVWKAPYGRKSNWVVESAKISGAQNICVLALYQQQRWRTGEHWCTWQCLPPTGLTYKECLIFSEDIDLCVGKCSYTGDRLGWGVGLIGILISICSFITKPFVRLLVKLPVSESSRSTQVWLLPLWRCMTPPWRGRLSSATRASHLLVGVMLSITCRTRRKSRLPPPQRPIERRYVISWLLASLTRAARIVQSICGLYIQQSWQITANQLAQALATAAAQAARAPAATGQVGQTSQSSTPATTSQLSAALSQVRTISCSIWAVWVTIIYHPTGSGDHPRSFLISASSAYTIWRRGGKLRQPAAAAARYGNHRWPSGNTGTTGRWRQCPASTGVHLWQHVTSAKSCDTSRLIHNVYLCRWEFEPRYNLSVTNKGHKTKPYNVLCVTEI